MADTQIMIALDDPKSAGSVARQLRPRVTRFKLGSSVLTHPRAHSIINRLRDLGAEITLDLNVETAPHVAQITAYNLARYWKASAITVPASGKLLMMRQVVDGARAAERQVEVIANTIGSWIDNEVLAKAWEDPATSFEVMMKARAVAAMDAGCVGVIASPLEVGYIRQALGDKAFIWATGIRRPGVHFQNEDLRRTGSVRQAIDGGANGLIIGRAATEARNPLEGLHQLLNPNPGSDEESIPPGLLRR